MISRCEETGEVGEKGKGAVDRSKSALFLLRCGVGGKKAGRLP